MHIIMGNLSYPRVKCYWENKLFIPMIVDRFFKLRQHLYFVKIQEKPANSTNRFRKVRPLYDILRSKMLQLPLENTLSLHQQMVPFKRRLNVTQYKGKPYLWGIKIFALWSTNSTMYDFLMYQGTSTEQ